MRNVFWIKLFSFIILFLMVDYSLFFVLKNGLDKFYGFNKSAEILISGTSVSIAGYNISELESDLDKKVALFAQNGASLELRNTMIKQFLDRNEGSVKTILFEVSPFMFSELKLAANGYKEFYPYLDDPVMNSFILKEEKKYSNYILHKYIKTSRFNNHLIKYSIQGYMGFYDNVKDLTVTNVTLDNLIEKRNTTPINLDEFKVKTFKETIKMLQDNKIQILLVNFPMTDALKQTYNQDDYNEYITFLQNLEEKFSLLSFTDFNNNEFNDYRFFSDGGHLNSKGQKKFTNEISSMLMSIY